MLLQTNSYVVPKDKRVEHARLMVRFRQCFRQLGSPFEVYEQTGPNFTGDGGGRYVQIMRFRDRQHQQEVHDREQQDPLAQQLIRDFCRLVNISYQQQHGLFAAAYYAGILRERPSDRVNEESGPDAGDEPAVEPTPDIEGVTDTDDRGDTGDTDGATPEFGEFDADDPGVGSDRPVEQSVEDVFAPFRRQEMSEYPVEQHIESFESSEGRAPPDRRVDRKVATPRAPAPRIAPR